jgi:hypothetical protein
MVVADTTQRFWGMLAMGPERMIDKGAGILKLPGEGDVRVG